MTNRLSIYIGLILIAVLAWDLSRDGVLLVFLGRQLLRLIEWLAIWR
ncbi:hypothetical protein [Anianabacter salinae]|nr:hypothetical protein [Anianabacter salinae]MBV0911532.1 hypothetical protein [Anianabacter salinae]